MILFSRRPPALGVLSALVLSLGAGCQLVPYVPAPMPAVIGENEVCIRGGPRIDQMASYYLVRANSVVLPGDVHAVAHLPAGRNVIDIQISVSTSEEGRFEGWEIHLPGGKGYVLVGERHRDAAQVWIEEEATGIRVTEIVSVAIIDHADFFGNLKIP